MQLGMIGLGRMGANMAMRLMKAGRTGFLRHRWRRRKSTFFLNANCEQPRRPLITSRSLSLVSSSLTGWGSRGGSIRRGPRTAASAGGSARETALTSRRRPFHPAGL